MRELKITIAISTSRDERDVIDMLMDGLVNHAGTLKSIVVEDKKAGTKKNYDSEVL